MAETFTWDLPMLGGQARPHNVGDPDCPACCHCIGPEACDDCGGILHAEMDDQDGDGEMCHSLRCDRPCGCGYCPNPKSAPTGGPDVH